MNGGRQSGISWIGIWILGLDTFHDADCCLDWLQNFPVVNRINIFLARLRYFWPQRFCLLVPILDVWIFGLNQL